MIHFRDELAERLKDLKFVLTKINESCHACSFRIRDAKIRDTVISMQADTEKHIALLERAIRICSKGVADDF